MSNFKEEIADLTAKRLAKSDFGFAYKVVKKVSAAFTGGTTNAHGNVGGTLAAYPLFTVSGDCLIHVFGICNVLPVGATGTLSIGVAGNTAALIALETASEIAAGNVFVSATQSVGVARLVGEPFVVAGPVGGTNLTVIETAATANITAGQIDYYCMWIALEPGAKVVAA